MSDSSSDTIVAVATPPGHGGVSILRLSGHDVPEFAQNFLGNVPQPRYATLAEFLDAEGRVIDHGIAVYFPEPKSYTGEHILELQAHGSPIVIQMLIQRCLKSGMRLAKPGEFSERAFLNGQLDLAQAESVADLIQSSTEAAARSAFKSLEGEFSQKVYRLVEQVTELRIFIEAAIDFPDEEIDFLADGEVFCRLQQLSEMFDNLKQSIKLGQLLKEGLKVVLTGLPNAGKSSLFNRLSNENRAIVSHIPGTTRDALKQTIQIDGLPVEIVDTAGIRESVDEIEAEGVRKALESQARADLILLIIDDSQTEQEIINDLLRELPSGIPTIVVHNKIDINSSRRILGTSKNRIYLSALTGDGFDNLLLEIKRIAGYRQDEDSLFIARGRHLDAIRRAEDHLVKGIAQLQVYRAGELLAEELTSCQRAMGEITGEVTSNDLLDQIFGSFCIGK